MLSPERQLKLLCAVNDCGRVDRTLDVRDKGVFYRPRKLRRRPRPAAVGRGSVRWKRRGEHNWPYNFPSLSY